MSHPLWKMTCFRKKTVSKEKKSEIFFFGSFRFYTCVKPIFQFSESEKFLRPPTLLFVKGTSKSLFSMFFAKIFKMSPLQKGVAGVQTSWLAQKTKKTWFKHVKNRNRKKNFFSIFFFLGSPKSGKIDQLGFIRLQTILPYPTPCGPKSRKKQSHK